jgi:7-carboxy-7-deazaguanine synthase
MNLRVVEIFRSIQGESTRAGQECVFVRLAGCDVGCVYCDTPQAHRLDAGREMSVEAVLAEVEKLLVNCRLVEITGGEPLLQRDGFIALAVALLAGGHTVMLETSGALSVAGLDQRIEIIMDVKTPGSGAAQRFCPENLSLLDANDEVKFVLTGRADYDWARRFLVAHDLGLVRAIHFSPAWGTLSAADLAAWMLADGGPARLTVQLHKLLGIA